MFGTDAWCRPVAGGNRQPGLVTDFLPVTEPGELSALRDARTAHTLVAAGSLPPDVRPGRIAFHGRGGRPVPEAETPVKLP